MSKTPEEILVEVSADYDKMVTKFTELTDMVNALTAKLTQQGVAQEGMAFPSCTNGEARG